MRYTSKQIHSVDITDAMTEIMYKGKWYKVKKFYFVFHNFIEDIKILYSQWFVL